MDRQDQWCVFCDYQSFWCDFDVLFMYGCDFFDQMLWVQYDVIVDDRQFVIVYNIRWQCVQFIDFVVNNEGMVCVVVFLELCDDVSMFVELIDDFVFFFIVLLGVDDDDVCYIWFFLEIKFVFFQ